MADAGFPITEQHAHERRSHALEIAPLGDRIQDPLIGEANGRLEPVRGDGEVRVVLVGPRDLGILARRGDEIGDRVDGNSGGDFAGRVATHPVGDEEEVVLRNDGEAVLVVLALASDVGHAIVDDLHAKFPGASFEWRDRISSSSERSYGVASVRYPCMYRRCWRVTPAASAP